MLSKNVILVDTSYIDKVSSDFTVNFERMLNRTLPKADLPLWLDCISLDAGLEPGENDIQVIFLYKNEILTSFTPSNIKDELDGKAFKDNLGEFSLEAYQVETNVTTMGEQFAETLRVLIDAEKVEKILAVPDITAYGNLVIDIASKNEKKDLCMFSIQPLSGNGFHVQQLGFSVVHALGINGDELQA